MSNTLWHSLKTTQACENVIEGFCGISVPPSGREIPLVHCTGGYTAIRMVKENWSFVTAIKQHEH